MRALLLFADDEVGRIEGWLRIAGGEVAARGAGLDHLPAPKDDEVLVLVLPGPETALCWLDIAALTEAQALAAARISLASKSLGPIDTLHVAMGSTHGGQRLIATISDSLMRAWLGWAASVGIDPDHVVPLPLLLAYGDGAARVWQRRGRGVVHGHQLAFAIEADLLDAVLGHEPREPVDDARFEAGLAEALASLPLDLRQGAHRRRRPWLVDGAWRKRIGRYALVAGVLLALIPFARLARLNFDSYQLRSEAANVAQATLGLPEKPADPRVALRQRLEMLEGPGFIDSAAILFGAVRQTPNVELASLAFDERGTLSADVSTASAADLAELLRRICSSGLVVEAQGGSVAGTSKIRISAP